MNERKTVSGLAKRVAVLSLGCALVLACGSKKPPVQAPTDDDTTNDQAAEALAAKMGGNPSAQGGTGAGADPAAAAPPPTSAPTSTAPFVAPTGPMVVAGGASGGAKYGAGTQPGARIPIGGENASSCQACGRGIVTPELQKSMVSHATQSKRCYLDYLNDHPKARAEITIEARINADGTLCDVAGILDDGTDQDVGECVLGRFRMGDFPKPGNNDCAIARLPIDYQPGK